MYCQHKEKTDGAKGQSDDNKAKELFIKTVLTALVCIGSRENDAVIVRC